MDSTLIAASFSFAVFLSYLATIAKVAIGLGFVIFVHELGHFLAAKACGVKCEKFYVGFDIPIKIGPFKLPSNLGKFTWGETEYGIGILPLGGYVKMLGQDDNPMNAEKEAERIRMESEESEDSSQPETVELDPRSFPAKPVWQRLIIISAGVIMNLIFAVVFAAVAYKMGVEYVPCEIAGVTPGDPAWTKDFRAGDKIVQIGKNGAVDENMRFNWELREKVAMAGAGNKVHSLDVLIRRDGKETWHVIKPTDRAKEIRKSVSLGVLPPSTTKIPAEGFAFPGTPANEIAELGGNRVIAVNGVSLPRDKETNEIFSYHYLRELLKNVDKPVELTLEETNVEEGKKPEVKKVTLAPRPTKTLGMVMTMGKILAVQQGSNGEKAGFKTDDVMTKLNGKPIGDPMTLEQRLRKLEGKEITVTVTRDGKSVDLKIKVAPTTIYAELYTTMAPAAAVSLGIAFDVTMKVAAVEPGSAAAAEGVVAGDKVEAFQVGFTDDADPELVTKAKKVFRSLIKEPFETSWPDIHTTAQSLYPGMYVELTIKRNGSSQVKKLVPKDSDKFFETRRGTRFIQFNRVHAAATWGEASKLGLRETKEKLGSVSKMLYLLFTGQISPKNLGGPVMIAYVAGSEANRGIAPLLIFLTMLSANLAILNFLPIPALDGGHAVFLVWEGVTGKPASERIQGTLTLIDVALLLCLMLFVFVLDIGRLIP